VAASNVELLQAVYPDRRRVTALFVEADGTWSCDECTADGKTTTGRLNPEQIRDLQELLRDPALEREADQTRRFRPQCASGLLSTLVTDQGLISFADCPGEQPPRIAGAIFHLLVTATPAKKTREEA
jgi:hypothetical protein